MGRIPCLDCNNSHKCGIVCCSKICFDEKCDCLAQNNEIAQGLYRCDYCELIIAKNPDVFVDYFICVESWYKEFCKKHEKWIYTLEQQKLLGTLDEENCHKYEIIQTFVAAKSNFSHAILATTRLETMLIRKNAFALVQAFEKVKKIII